MQQQFMPFGWPLPQYLPLPPIIEDNDLFINSIVSGPGTPGPQGETGPQGEAGVGVVSAEVTDNPGDLVLTLTDGTTINAGNVIGPPGPEGPPGPSGSSTTQVVTIVQDYTATETDCYIGCDLLGPATVTLPAANTPGKTYNIKLEFGAPVGTRKLTVKPTAPALINGVTALTLTTPYESLSVLYNNNRYWTI